MVALKAWSQFNAFPKRSSSGSIRRPPYPKVSNDLVVGFFDGSSSSNGSVCASGVVIKMLNGTTHLIRFNSGEGLNSKEELLGLWALLFISSQLNIHQLQVCGDSKLIIDWALNKSAFKVINLEFWQLKVDNLCKKISRLDFYHIYREFNYQADLLANQASSLPEGRIFFQSSMNGVLGNVDSILVF
jgi:ribonuclease HI